jgi:hypothetical protein
LDLTWHPDRAPAGDAAPEVVPFRQGHGLRFVRVKQTRLDLKQGDGGTLRLAGPMTLEAIVQMEALPPTKVSLISKWETRPGGRSYELGVTPFGWLFFTVSASGNWDGRAAELMSNRMMQPGVPYHVAAVFEPASRMALFVNGEASGELREGVPDSIFDSSTPVWLGNRFRNQAACGFEGILGSVRIHSVARDAASIAVRAAAVGLDQPIPGSTAIRLQVPYNLDQVRERCRQWYAQLQSQDQPYGAYRLTPAQPPDLYASADLAWIRWMMNDLSLSVPQRQQWIGFIQDQQSPSDGTYRHITGHCPAHAFCHATGALNMLGGRHRHPPRFLAPYRDVQRIPAWLEQIDWEKQWGASHDIWGAGLPLAASDETPQAWRDALFAWLDEAADPATGYWRKGVKARSPIEYLGGAFHIWPIYAALGKPLLYPERLIDQLLALQGPNGSFERGFGYGNMDGVWALERLSKQVLYRADEVRAALQRDLEGLIRVYDDHPSQFFADAHGTESRIATLAILQAALPEKFTSSAVWRNPWHERDLFRIKVESP